jgi:hypothetical protein
VPLFLVGFGMQFALRVWGRSVDPVSFVNANVGVVDDFANTFAHVR